MIHAASRAKTLVTSKLERWSYGSYSFGQNLIYMLQLQFLTYFYTEEVGLSLGATATLLFVAKLWDALNDPIMGVVVDKLELKTGKYTPWLKLMSVFVPLTLLFAFVNLDAAYSLKLAFAYMTYILWGMAYTVSDSPMFSLSTVMSPSVYERDRLIASARMAGALAAIATAVFMMLKGSLGWFGAVAVYCAAALLTMLPLPFVAKERVSYRTTETVPIWQFIKSLLRNKYFFIFYTGYLFMSATNTLQTIAAYFANSNLGNEQMLTVLLAVLVLPIVIVSPLLPSLIVAFGKKRLMIACCIITILLCLIQYAVGYEHFALFLVIAAVRVLVMQIPLLLYGMFTADCIEYGNAITGQRAAALAFSVQTMFTKLAGALSSSLCLVLLAYFGYVEQAAQQTQEALHGIWIIFTLVPIIGYSVMLVAMRFYRLDEAKVAQYLEENQKKATFAK